MNLIVNTVSSETIFLNINSVQFIKEHDWDKDIHSYIPATLYISSGSDEYRLYFESYEETNQIYQELKLAIVNGAELFKMDALDLKCVSGSDY